MNLFQIRLLRVLVEQLIQSPKYAEDFENGKTEFLDNQPFASFGGVGAYIQAFGEKTKPIFTHIKQSPPLRLALMK